MLKFAAVIMAALTLGAVATNAAYAQSGESKLDKARELVEIRGARKMYSSLGPAAIEQLTDGSARLMEQLKLPSRPLQREILKSIIAEDFDKIFVPQAIEYGARAYAEEFTDQQLTEILNFYNSPTGRLYVEKETQILQRQTLTRDVLSVLFRDAILKYCHQTSCPQSEYDQLEEATDPKPRGKPNTSG